MIPLIISILALVCSVIALVFSYKRKNKTEIITKTETEVIYPPLENPFIYDEKDNTYTLMGDLKVNGFVSSLNKEK